MDEHSKPCAATLPEELSEQIMNPNVPKNEREWWAYHHIESLGAELTTLRAQNAHWENVARATNAKLGVALEAVMAVVSATRQYLPPDGISQHECISLVLEATDNPRINQLILAEEARNALAQVAK